jgi:hypothetical protein
LPAELVDRGQQHFPVARIDLLQPAGIITEQLIGVTAEEVPGGRANEGDLGLEPRWLP